MWEDSRTGILDSWAVLSLQAGLGSNPALYRLRGAMATSILSLGPHLHIVEPSDDTNKDS